MSAQADAATGRDSHFCLYLFLFLTVNPAERRDAEQPGVSARPHYQATLVLSGPGLGIKPQQQRALGPPPSTGSDGRPRPCPGLRRTQSGSAAHGHHPGGQHQQRLNAAAGRRASGGGRLPPAKRPSVHRTLLPGPERAAAGRDLAGTGRQEAPQEAGLPRQ